MILLARDVLKVGRLKGGKLEVRKREVEQCRTALQLTMTKWVASAPRFKMITADSTTRK